MALSTLKKKTLRFLKGKCPISMRKNINLGKAPKGQWFHFLSSKRPSLTKIYYETREKTPKKKVPFSRIQKNYLFLFHNVSHKDGGPVNHQHKAPLLRHLWGTSQWPQPPRLSPKHCDTNGRRIAMQMGSVLRYKWEEYWSLSLSWELSGSESTAIQIGGVLQYKLEVYCNTFREVVVVGVSDVLLNFCYGLTSSTCSLLQIPACCRDLLATDCPTFRTQQSSDALGTLLWILLQYNWSQGLAIPRPFLVRSVDLDAPTDNM